MDAENRALYSELNPYRSICPMCSSGTVVLGTKAGDKFGVCQLCYTRALVRVKERQAMEADALREYKRASKNSERARHAAGVHVDPKNSGNRHADPFEVLSHESVL